MVFYNDQESTTRTTGAEFKNQMIQAPKFSSVDSLLNPKTKAIRENIHFPKPKYNDLNDYMVVMRQPTFLEQKANPSLKSVVTNIIDKKSPYRNVAPEDVGMGGITKLSANNNVSEFLTKQGAEKFQKEKYRSIEDKPIMASKVKQQEAWYTPYKPINPSVFKDQNKPIYNGNSLHITDSKGEYLFKLQGDNEKEDTINAKQLYLTKKQWFAPEADNYMPITDINKNIKENKSLKHATSDDIFKFADTPRRLFDFAAGGSGDWKAQKKGGDGYMMATVDGKPYWTDAIGQVPFAVNTYKNSLLTGNTPNVSKRLTSTLGGFAAEGGLSNIVKRVATLNPDTSNSYDNQIIKKTLDWASEKYKKPTRSTYLHTTDHSPRKLFDYEIEYK